MSGFVLFVYYALLRVVIKEALVYFIKNIKKDVVCLNIKKLIEDNCLLETIKFLRKTKMASTEICDLLESEKYGNGDSERPDFIKRHKCNDHYCYIGIEHFAADRNSFVNQNRVIESRGGIQKSNFIMAKENIKTTSNTKQKICKIIAFSTAYIMDLFGLSVAHNNAMLYESFEFSLLKHLEKVQNYKDNICSKMDDGDTMKMVLLAEISTQKQDFVLYSKNWSYKPKNIKRPYLYMQKGLYDILYKYKHLLRQVDYIVLSLYGQVPNELIGVIVLNTHDCFDKQLKAQKVIVAEYIGDDCFDDSEREIVLYNRDIKFDEDEFLTNVQRAANRFSNIINSITATKQRVREQRAFEKCSEFESLGKQYVTTVFFKLKLMQHKKRSKKLKLKG